FIHSKGAILVLLWDLLIGISFNLLISFLTFEDQFGIVILYPLLLVTLGCVRVNLLPFNIDQLIGSSSDELTAVIHWHNIGPVVSNALIQVLSSTYNSLTLYLYFILCAVLVAMILVTHNLFNHYLDTTPVNTTNPIKLIARTLCYARKHKYPENRSALTYWEEEAPSRLDLGKDKYGGPFTEEEVEDVKTVLRLIPLLLICSIASGLNGYYTEGIYSEIYGCQYTLAGSISFNTVYVFIILLHQFLIYPCFHKYIPSMLKRIGLGIGLILAVNIAYMILAVIGYYHIEEMFHCLTSFEEQSYTKGHIWTIFNGIFVAVVFYINGIVLVEFILAQCPKSMRGTVIGLWLCIRILRIYISFVVLLPFLRYMNSEFLLGRGFYFCLTRALLSFFLLLLYIYLAKKYKFRIREVEINVHMIAENHIIRNIEQDEEYWRRREEEHPSDIF
uniref:Uncharacterized protein n=1 Tax=Amphimedon queenslandica TaxID=400682 RepID=A0A1X7TSR0_AMPQE